ncbi:hypothetical protein TNCV_3400721 [Trichonephila clavipes]|nr:hypothetical protein TNCV_3400721 [Trichonephila clavipes]
MIRKFDGRPNRKQSSDCFNMYSPTLTERLSDIRADLSAKSQSFNVIADGSLFRFFIFSVPPSGMKRESIDPQLVGRREN